MVSDDFNQTAVLRATVDSSPCLCHWNIALHVRDVGGRGGAACHSCGTHLTLCASRTHNALPSSSYLRAAVTHACLALFHVFSTLVSLTLRLASAPDAPLLPPSKQQLFPASVLSHGLGGMRCVFRPKRILPSLLLSLPFLG